MNNTRELFIKGKEILKTGGIETYAFDAAVLFSHFCGISKSELIFSEKVPKNPEGYLNACTKRSEGYPLQYIVGSWEFYGLEFMVNESVLIPRADTETLIDYIVQKYSGKIRILDMCCGSGCIGLTLKKKLPFAEVTLCDISKDALEVTKENAKNLGLEVTVKEADLTKGYSRYFKKEAFDIIVSNPPYITTSDMETLSKEVKCEPHIALWGGDEGMDFYTALAKDWKDCLKIGGEMIFETGYDTADKVSDLFLNLGYTDINTKYDMGGIKRLVAATRRENI